MKSTSLLTAFQPEGGNAPRLRPSPPSPGGRGVGGEGITAKARALRSNMTLAERALWRALRRDALGLRFRRQVAFDKRFILDFYAPELRLAVEVDGGQHAGAVSDLARDRYLASRGVTTVRFWNGAMMQNVSGVVVRIDAVIDALRAWRMVPTSPLAPLLPGGGDRSYDDMCVVPAACYVAGAAAPKTSR
ncbi:MAG: DUF559 domain-containing protein [Pseudomonadota bacterium]